jgi:hypothetical protein
MDLDFQIFKSKKFSDLCEDIYDNSTHKQKQIDIIIKDLRVLITTSNEALLIAPLIKEYIDVSVRNDEHLIKLAAVIQRFTGSTNKDESGNTILTDEEKKQLLDCLDEIEVSQKELDKTKEIIDKDKTKEVNSEIKKNKKSL